MVAYFYINVSGFWFVICLYINIVYIWGHSHSSSPCYSSWIIWVLWMKIYIFLAFDILRKRWSCSTVLLYLIYSIYRVTVIFVSFVTRFLSLSWYWFMLDVLFGFYYLLKMKWCKLLLHHWWSFHCFALSTYFIYNLVLLRVRVIFL